jgi:hypothetical protein
MTHSGGAAGGAVERLLSEHLFFYQTQSYCSGSESEFFHPKSRSKKHRIPDPDPQQNFSSLTTEFSKKLL